MSALEPTAPCSQDVLIFVLNILTGNVLLFVYHIALRQAIITPTSEWCMMSLGLALWVTGTEGLGVTHMLYADDLTLTANDPVQLQKMLRRLESYVLQ